RFDLDSQRSAEQIERVTILPVRTESSGKGEGGTVRSSLLDLLPSDALLVLDQESALDREVDRAWAEAEHHLEDGRRTGEGPPARAQTFVDPARCRAGPAAVARPPR